MDGLTTGNNSFDGIFILRNPENCNLVDYSLKGIPIYVERKTKINYDICMDFWELPKKAEVKGIVETAPIHIRDIEVTLFVVDYSNPNTQMIRFKGKDGKSVVVSR